MLKPETNERLQDVAYDIEQALKAIGENPSSYDLGLFEGKMIGLSIKLNAVACEIERYCEKGNSESTVEWIPYEGSKLRGRCVVISESGQLFVSERPCTYEPPEYYTHYLMLPELPKQGNEDAKS